MIPPRHLADPVAKHPLTPSADGLAAADGQLYPPLGGGWDLRPRAPGVTLDDANKSLQADIYDARLGEMSDFDHPHNLMLVHQKRLLEALPLAPGDRVLEVGGHRSGLLAWLERTRRIAGSGLDISPYWVVAQNRAARARGSDTVWVLGDAEALPYASGTFKAMVAFDVFEHLTHLDRGLSEAFRVLQPGGRLVIHMPVQDIGGSFDGYQRWKDAADYAARQASVGHFHERMPTRQQMRTRMEGEGFQVLDMESFNVWIQPLHDHRFLPALGRLKHARASRGPTANPPAFGAGGQAPAQRPPATSAFTRVYAKTVVPLASAFAAVDRVGSLLGIGGSCSFVAVKPA
jgi:ubiquinone/menaquinone biosynthesis C-methylase UbiE